MGKRLRTHVRSNVVGYVALVFALGLGSAYAANEIGRNTVTAKAIKKNAVRPPEIAKNAVRSSEIARNAVKTDEVADGSLLEQDFAPGQLPAGPQGDPGQQGPPGEDATNLFGYVRDPGNGDPVIEFGNGITGAVKLPDTSYRVSFNRDLTGCAVHADVGFGKPHSGGGAIAPGTAASIVVNGSSADIGFYRVVNNTFTTVRLSTSFMVTAFC